MNDATVKMYGELLGLSQRQEQLARVVGMMNEGNKSLLNEVKLLRKQLRTLQGVVGSLQQDVAALEEKVALMEKVLNVEVLPHMQEPCEDDIDNATADRADFLSDFAQGHDWEKMSREGFTL